MLGRERPSTTTRTTWLTKTRYSVSTASSRRSATVSFRASADRHRPAPATRPQRSAAARRWRPATARFRSIARTCSAETRKKAAWLAKRSSCPATEIRSHPTGSRRGSGERQPPCRAFEGSRRCSSPKAVRGAASSGRRTTRICRACGRGCSGIRAACRRATPRSSAGTIRPTLIRRT